MKTKHTPDPWEIDKTMNACGWDIRAGGIWIGTANGDHYIEGERPGGGFPGNTEGKANGILMAGAPKLLEACEKARDEIGAPSPEYPANIANAFDILNTIIAEYAGEEPQEQEN